LKSLAVDAGDGHDDRVRGVNIGGVRLGRLSDGERARLLAAARRSAPTYDHVGSTLDRGRDDRAVRTRQLDVGRGQGAFDAARRAVRSWVPQRALGAEVVPADQLVALDESVVVVLRAGPFYVIAPNRIVVVIDEPRCFAFAYGTLPGHPERGEESFSVDWRTDDTVRATIRVHAGPAIAAARAMGPLVGVLQGLAVGRYLRSIGRAVAAETQETSV
jgi:uncharacterized protein (UPF0548 family)